MAEKAEHKVLQINANLCICTINSILVICIYPPSIASINQLIMMVNANNLRQKCTFQINTCKQKTSYITRVHTLDLNTNVPVRFCPARCWLASPSRTRRPACEAPLHRSDCPDGRTAEPAAADPLCQPPATTIDGTRSDSVANPLVRCPAVRHNDRAVDNGATGPRRTRAPSETSVCNGNAWPRRQIKVTAKSKHNNHDDKLIKS